MKILIVTHTFAPNVGGVETYLRLLAEGLVALPVDRGSPVKVTVATRTPRGDHDDGAFQYRVVREPSAAELWRLVSEADVVHLAGPTLGPLFIGLLGRKPIVVEHHAYQSICPNGLLLHEPDKTACKGQFMARRYDDCLRCVAAAEGGPLAAAKQVLLTFPRRALLRTVAANIGVSDHVTRRIGLPHSTTIWHGIDDPLRGRPVAETASSEAAPVFGYVGRLVSEKGLTLLLEAARILTLDGRRFSVRFVGDGDQRALLQRRALELGIADRVVFAGFLRGAAFEAAVEDLTAVVMPSVWEESAGLAAIEQMMRGRVVIASRTGGLAEIVGNAGLTFPVGDAGGLASCLRRLLSEPGLASALGRQARARAIERFGKQRMAEDHLRLYREVIGR
jgi:glycosyltransferase involved in cell wall biosynthesis